MLLHRPGAGALARRVYPIAALAMFAAITCLVAVRVAGAAASLGASENPVVIPHGQSSGAVTVSWDLGGQSSALLAVRENGGPTVFSRTVTTQTGSVPIRVTFGETYTATLTTPRLAGPLATLTIRVIRLGPPPGAQVSTPPPAVTGAGNVTQATAPPLSRLPTPTPGFVGPAQPTTNPGGTLGQSSTPPPLMRLPTPTPLGVIRSPPQPSGCALQCIKTVLVESWAEQTHVRVETDTPANIRFESIFRFEHYSDYWPPHPSKIASGNGAMMLDTTLDMGGKRGAVYDWIVTATDEQGNVAERKGSLVVRHRVAHVFFNSIGIANDGDDGGTGECLFWFYASDNPDTLFDNPAGDYTNNDCDDAKDYSLLDACICKSFIDARSTITLYAKGGDDDTDSIFPIGLDSNPFNEWAEVQETHSMKGAPKTKNFALIAYESAAGTFAFDVSGSYGWIYE